MRRSPSRRPLKSSCSRRAASCRSSSRATSFKEFKGIPRKPAGRRNRQVTEISLRRAHVAARLRREARTLSKGVLQQLSRWEFKLRGVTPRLRPQLQKETIMDIVVAQMIVTGVLLFAFSVEVLLGHIIPSK